MATDTDLVREKYPLLTIQDTIRQTYCQQHRKIKFKCLRVVYLSGGSGQKPQNGKTKIS